MDQTLTRTNADRPALSVGGLLVEALARQDFTALAGCLDPDARLRALLPRGPIEITGRDQVAGWLEVHFGQTWADTALTMRAVNLAIELRAIMPRIERGSGIRAVLWS